MQVPYLKIKIKLFTNFFFLNITDIKNKLLFNIVLGQAQKNILR